MKNMHKTDPGSLIIMTITLVLFIAAVFSTGFTHDVLLEAGVFLVSVKLIIMNYKQQVSADAIQRKLDDIKLLISRQQQP